MILLRSLLIAPRLRPVTAIAILSMACALTIGCGRQRRIGCPEGAGACGSALPATTAVDASVTAGVPSATPTATEVPAPTAQTQSPVAGLPPATIGPDALATINACVPGSVQHVSDCASDGASGVEGEVLVGPTCPVERADSPCPDRPAQLYVWTSILSGSDTPIGNPMTQSGTDGRFRLALPPGTYMLDAGPCSPTMFCGPNSSLPRITPQIVTVRTGAFTKIILHGDTGIR
jgi:hypothetical protein